MLRRLSCGVPQGKGQKGPAASLVEAEVAGSLYAGLQWHADGPPQRRPGSVELQHSGEKRGKPAPMLVGNDLPQTYHDRQLPLNSLC